MTTKKVQPKNPDTKATKTEKSPETERKTQGARFGGRKSARKSNHLSNGH